MQWKVAFALVIAILVSSAAMAQVPKFTIVSITTDPPGPLAPGAKFKIKVKVRNDGDTIPAGRRFDFIFTSPNAVAIAIPTGTPALFFGYCPGATPNSMVCLCFAAWEKGQTVEMETEVTVGNNARGTVTVSFEVKSGAASATGSITVQIVLAGPDLVPDINVDLKDEFQKRGEVANVFPRLKNIGTAPTQGEIKVTIALSEGLEFWGDDHYRATLTTETVVAPGETYEGFFFNKQMRIFHLGIQSIALNVSGGADVDLSNNSKTFKFEVVRELPDHLNRVINLDRLAEVFGR